MLKSCARKPMRKFLRKFNRPLSALYWFASNRRSELFPEPLGPTKPIRSCWSIRRLSLSMRVFPPNDRLICSKTTRLTARVYLKRGSKESKKVGRGAIYYMTWDMEGSLNSPPYYSYRRRTEPRMARLFQPVAVYSYSRAKRRSGTAFLVKR